MSTCLILHCAQTLNYQSSLILHICQSWQNCSKSLLHLLQPACRSVVCTLLTVVRPTFRSQTKLATKLRDIEQKDSSNDQWAQCYGFLWECKQPVSHSFYSVSFNGALHLNFVNESIRLKNVPFSMASGLSTVSGYIKHIQIIITHITIDAMVDIIPHAIAPGMYHVV